jgi:hypothetical protein
MPVFYQDISVQLIGSAYEGTPNPLLEAMSMGRPVITTDVGLARKLITPGENGFIVKRDAQAFASKIKMLAGSTRADLAAIGKKARRSAERHSWKVKAEAWRQMLNFASLGRDTCRVHGKVEVAAPDPPPKRGTPEPPEEPSNIKPVRPPKPERRKPPVGKPRVLLISDVPDWAFHQNMKDLELTLGDRFTFEHWFIVDYQKTAYVPDMERFDAIFCVYHRWNIEMQLPLSRTLGSLRAYWFFPENPGPVGQKEYNVVNRYRAFHVVTQANYDQLRENHVAAATSGQFFQNTA